MRQPIKQRPQKRIRKPSGKRSNSVDNTKETCEEYFPIKKKRLEVQECDRQNSEKESPDGHETLHSRPSVSESSQDGEQELKRGSRKKNTKVTRYYPLRSRLRIEQIKQQQNDFKSGTKTFDHLPAEVYCKVFQYLCIQDLLKIQRVNSRFKAAVQKYLLLVKRVNFCSGLPFAFLPDSLDDKTLKRVIQMTPQVTHILGFYPRRVYDGVTLPLSDLGSCLPPPPLTYTGIMSAFRSASKLHSVEIMDVDLMARVVTGLQRVKFHGMFRNRPYSWDDEYAAKIPPTSSQSHHRSSDAPPGSSGSGAPPHFTSSNPGLIYPIPKYSDRLVLPNSIHNLTKMELVSVCITGMPRLENIKYLHLKWVRFSGGDPFQHFSAPKLQTFVMNNCVGPTRALRYIRIFTALARATQLTRVEVVSTRFVDGLLEHIVEDPQLGNGGRSFRSLQRLVLAGNRDCGEGDLGCVLIAASASLCHLAVQVSHTKDTLFLALNNAGVRFLKMDSLVLGYQDPFQSRLTAGEVSILDLVDWPEQGHPVSLLTDQGFAAALLCCPRLNSVHVRKAPYLESPVRWAPSYWTEEDVSGSLPVRSLTLENCPGIKTQALEALLNESIVTPTLEMLVLRDMFPTLPQTYSSAYSHSENLDEDIAHGEHLWPEVRRLADHLATNGAGQGTNVMQIGIGIGIRGHELLRPGDVHSALRVYRYFMQLQQLGVSAKIHADPKLLKQTTESDGSDTGHSKTKRGRPNKKYKVQAQTTECKPLMTHLGSPAEFASRGTQTCLCGLLEWQQIQWRHRGVHLPTTPTPTPNNPVRLYVVNSNRTASANGSPASGAGVNVPNSENTSPPSPPKPKIFHAVPDACWICTKQGRRRISIDRAEPKLSHHMREWTAVDASVDTTTLRVRLPPPTQCLTLDTELLLSTLHLEKVGITHLAIRGAWRLRHLTLENCPSLEAVIVQSGVEGGGRPGMTRAADVLPCLRRVRVVRCPKLAVYHFLYSMAELMHPHQREENLSITLRPFGEYNPMVERALWQGAGGGSHVLVSHDYKRASSERELEELASSFDQLAREVFNFSDTLIKREYLAVQETPSVNSFSNGTFMRSEHGEDWDLTTDIPWISEVCCSMLPNDLTRQELADQLYALLADIQVTSGQLKLCRRGIHLHVQCRDIHPSDYLLEPYTDEYLARTHPLADVNAHHCLTPVPHPRPPSPDCVPDCTAKEAPETPETTTTSCQAGGWDWSCLYPPGKASTDPNPGGPRVSFLDNEDCKSTSSSSSSSGHTPEFVRCDSVPMEMDDDDDDMPPILGHPN